VTPLKLNEKNAIAQELDALEKATQEDMPLNETEPTTDAPSVDDSSVAAPSVDDAAVDTSAIDIPVIDQKEIKPESRRDMRALAFHFLYAVDRFDYTMPLETIVANFKVGFNLEVADDAPAIEMARGAIDGLEELDEQIKPLLRNWRLERLGCCTKLILRLALWELKQPDAIPNIVINEAIELAKSFAEKDAYKFINGILDEACKVLFPEKKTTEET